MSEYKPITGELRDMMETDEQCGDLFGINYLRISEGRLCRLCDAIDAVHAQLERENESLKAELDRVLGEQEDRDGWPKDADGEYIHIGDVMEWVRYKDDDPTIVRTVSGIGNGVFFAWSDEQGRYAQYEAHAYRHHQPDTWERIIEDARICTGSAGNFTSVPSMRWTNEVDALVARCKALCERTKGADE